MLHRVWFFVTPWSATPLAPLSMGFSAKNTGVGYHFLLQGIFLTQGFWSYHLRCRQILYSWAIWEALVRVLYQCLISICLMYWFWIWNYSRFLFAFIFSKILNQTCNMIPVFCLFLDPTLTFLCMFLIYTLKYCNIFLQVCVFLPLHPTPVVLPGKSNGQRSLVGCSPWGH